MSAVRMDGKALSAKVRGSILAETEALKKQGVTPGLAVIIVGNDPASEIYVRNKERACEQCGFYSEKYALPEETTQEELLGLIAQLNESPAISGILCQMPVPKHISEQAVIDAIDPKKDVDAFHPVNVGKIMVGNFDFVPCTPAGVMELLDEYKIDPKGKECVVVGRSNIVGKPMSMLLLHRHGTVTICHSRTQDLAEVCRRADILVAAVGKAPGEVNPELAKQVLGDEQPMTGRFADTLEPEFPAAREHLGTHARSEEDVLSYIAFPQQAEQFFERREQTFTASYSFKEVK